MKEISKLIVSNLATGVKFPFSKRKQDMEEKKRDTNATREINSNNKRRKGRMDKSHIRINHKVKKKTTS